MRGNAPAHQFRRAKSLDEALTLLSEAPGLWTPLAGGTDLMVYLESGTLAPGRFLDLWALEVLRGIRVESDTVRIGALSTYRDVRDNAHLAAELPNLCDAARLSGAIAIQNRGTIGGNIVNGSPAADTPPALLACEAELELVSIRGTRRVPYAAFHTGYKQMDLAPDELICAIHVPRPDPETVHYYRKVGTRRAQAISKVCLAGTIRLEEGRVAHCRLGYGSIAATPWRATMVEELLEGEVLNAALVSEAVAAVRDAVLPLDDIRSTARYREAITGNLLADMLGASRLD